MAIMCELFLCLPSTFAHSRRKDVQIKVNLFSVGFSWISLGLYSFISTIPVQYWIPSSELGFEKPQKLRFWLGQARRIWRPKIWMLLGANLLISSQKKHWRQLPTSKKILPSVFYISNPGKAKQQTCKSKPWHFNKGIKCNKFLNN